MESIPLFEINWDENDVKNVVESVARGGYWAKGPFIEEFEDRIKAHLGVDHAVAVNSGTTALIAALYAHEIGAGDEVIVPSFTQQATVNAVEFVGATPVFADIERETYGLDPADVSEKATADTGAILPVHVYGSVCQIEPLLEIASGHDAVLIEDAAEAQGAKRDGKKAGTFGDAAALSFCQNKIVATGEGGAVVTDEEEMASQIRLYRSHGRSSTDYFGSAKSGEHVAVGGNFRMPDVVASLGCSQMDKIEDLIQGRRDAAIKLNEAFDQMEGVEPHQLKNGRHVYQFYTITLAEPVDRDAVIEELADDGISSKVYWDPPVHQSTYYRSRYGDVTLPVTEELSTRVLSLPIYPHIESHTVDRIIRGVRDAVNAVA